MSEMQKDVSRFAESAKFFSRSKRYLAGGVSSGMRASAKPMPLFFSAGAGSRLTDVDGNCFIDYALAWGPLIVGHSHPTIVDAVSTQLRMCQALGAQNELEITVARKICEMVPCAERVVFSNTGTEAVQVALRLARAFTGRRKIIRFEGHYHGWLDDVLIGYRPKLESLSRTTASPSNAEIVVLQWNNLHDVEAVLQREGDEIAAIITEPILCNCHCLLPVRGYLQGLRDLATRYGVVLIFDEVITGFRVAAGGAQALFGVTPDLATFGKAVAAGFPLSVVAGKQEIMGLIEEGKVIHAGTFNGNPISLAAAAAALRLLDADKGAAIEQIRRSGEKLMHQIGKSAKASGVPILVNGVGASFHLAFTVREKMANFRDTLDSDVAARDQFLTAMLERGVYLLSDGRWYLSLAHTEEDLKQTLVAVEEVLHTFKARLQPTDLNTAAAVSSS